MASSNATTVTDETNLQEQKQAWIREQLDVASQVKVLPDEFDYSQERKLEERFRLLPTQTMTDAAATSIQPTYYGGVDVSFPASEDDDSVAVYVILEAETMETVYQDSTYFPLTAPYIPGFLAFRETDVLERLVEKQKRQRPELTPRAILVDGNGILHPRRAGLACFLGVRTGIPTIGLGKTLLAEEDLTKERVWKDMDKSLQAATVHLKSHPPTEGGNDGLLFDVQGICAGRPESVSPPAVETELSKATPLHRATLVEQLRPYCFGYAIPLLNRQGTQAVACVMVGHGGRIRPDKRQAGCQVPVFVSVGHNVSLLEAVQICTALSLARIPEPVRRADLLGREMLREAGKI